MSRSGVRASVLRWRSSSASPGASWAAGRGVLEGGRPHCVLSSLVGGLTVSTLVVACVVRALSYPSPAISSGDRGHSLGDSVGKGVLGDLRQLPGPRGTSRQAQMRARLRGPLQVHGGRQDLTPVRGSAHARLRLTQAHFKLGIFRLQNDS